MRSKIRIMRYDYSIACELCGFRTPNDGRTKLAMKLHMRQSHNEPFTRRGTFPTQEIVQMSGKTEKTDLYLNKSLSKCPAKKVVIDTKSKSPT